MNTLLKPILALTAASATAALAGTIAPAPGPLAPTGDWLADTISPVTNPIFFEDPAIRSEVRPIYIHHSIPNNFLTGGDVDVFAVQLRYALTDRLALIATKDGYIDISLNNGTDLSGWGDLAAGLKYALIDDRANQFILTGGFTVELPTGSKEVLQGNGDGELNVFLSAAKGFGKFHLTGNTGLRLPFDGDEESTIWHFNLMADYKVHQYFHPFVSMSGIHVLEGGNMAGPTTEGYDLINFGSAAADGETQITLGAGFRSHLKPNLDFGIAYEWSVSSPEGLFDDRITADVIWRF